MNQPQNAQELRERADQFDVQIFEDGNQELDIYEDDGHLHLNHYGLRVSYTPANGQDSSRRDWNRDANGFLRELGYEQGYNGVGPV